MSAAVEEERYMGYLDTLKKYDLDVVPDYVIETDQTEKEGFEAMEKLLRSDDCPTGIYCANDITAVGMRNIWDAAGTFISHPRS